MSSRNSVIYSFNLIRHSYSQKRKCSVLILLKSEDTVMYISPTQCSMQSVSAIREGLSR